MEESLKQQPLEKIHTGKATPDPNTDFGDEAFDYTAMPQKRISIGGINEWIFSKMRPKSKYSAKVPIGPKEPIAQEPSQTTYPPTGIAQKVETLYQKFNPIPKGFEIQNGLLIQKKSLAERVRDQIKFPVLKSSKSLINGAALILFAIGSIAIYAELPTHPGLVIGMLIVAISANIIISNR